MLKKLLVALRLMWQHRLVTAEFVAAGTARSALQVGYLWMVKTFLEGIFKSLGTESGSQGTGMLWGAAALIFACWMGRSIADYFSKVLQTELGRRIELNLRLKIVQHMLKLSLSFFDKHTRGDIIRASSGDVTALRMLVDTTCSIITALLAAGGLLIAAAKMNANLALWGLVALPLALYPMMYIGTRLLEASRKARFHGVQIMNLLMQILAGIRIVKAFRGEEREAQACQNSAIEWFKQMMRMVRTRSLSGVIFDSLAGFGVVFVIVFGGMKMLEGTIDWPTLIAFILILNQLFGPIRNILHAYTMVKTQTVSLDRVDEMLATEPEIKDGKDALPLKTSPHEIKFDDVSYSYDTAMVLKDVNLKIRAGETIGVVGASGVGKTTLLNLAVRFYDPRKGSVLFDNTDIRKIRLADLMDSIAIVTQEPFLFNVSILENIRYGKPNATEREVIEAARAANIHDDIISWPGKYETVIGPGGTSVSVGQKQRINIARAVLKNAPILLLDEATSALDSITETLVQEALDKLMESRTTLVVAHRLSTLRKADKIAVLADGTVEAFAPHDELLGISDTYKKLWKAQQRQDGPQLA
ncbi:MAG TPA: ABC transporter ATP-binding protein [bacterium]|nr:ABC transporter ATP-binding protein [bacterium]